MSISFIFPGQGSQSVGMMSAMYETYPVVNDTFGEASEALGFDLWALIGGGPEEQLNQTSITQPAMLASGVACWRTWQELGGTTASMMAGHSLGEYSALVCAGAIDFADAIKLVAERGRLMQDAVPAGSGAMAAILGLDDDAVRTVCSQSAADQVVQAVNFNAPGQVVIAGNSEAVERAIANAKTAGAKRALKLPVSVPSHCDLMKPAAQQLDSYMQSLSFSTPVTPVVQNVSADIKHEEADIRIALVEQLHQPVLWVDTIRNMAAQGVTHMIEMGPGKVLSGLNKRIDKSLISLPIFDPESLEKALEAVK